MSPVLTCDLADYRGLADKFYGEAPALKLMLSRLGLSTLILGHLHTPVLDQHRTNAATASTERSATKAHG